MSVSDLLDEVVRDLTEELGTTGVVQHVFDPYGRAVHEYRSPPVVIWQPVSATYEPPRDGGGWETENRLWARRQEINIHIWGDDENQALDLVRDELVALHHVCNTSHRAVHDEPAAANEAWLTRGYAMILRVSVAMPVEDRATQTGRARRIVMGSGHADAQDVQQPPPAPSRDWWLESTGE